MKKPLVQKAKGQYPLAEMDPKAWEKFPLLRGFFLDAEYADDGGERQPGMIVLRADPNRWTVTLKDQTAMTTLFLAAPTLGDTWKLVEAALGDDKAPWVIDQWAQQRTRRAGQKRP